MTDDFIILQMNAKRMHAAREAVEKNGFQRVICEWMDSYEKTNRSHCVLCNERVSSQRRLGGLAVLLKNGAGLVTTICEHCYDGFETADLYQRSKRAIMKVYHRLNIHGGNA